VVIVVWMLTALLGFASLPDQTWLGGVWDAADDDEAILEVQSTTGTVETFVDTSTDTLLLIPTWFTLPPLETVVVPATVSPNQTRAPPTL
jgi:hypothetical protein